MIQPLVVHISRLLGLSSVPSRFSREQQRQASQHLLQLLYPHSTLAHSTDGAPQLQGSQIQLSLSHSGDYLALLTAPPRWRVGVDLETDFSRPLRLAARFLSQEELSLLSTLPLVSNRAMRWRLGALVRRSTKPSPTPRWTFAGTTPSLITPIDPSFLTIHRAKIRSKYPFTSTGIKSICSPIALYSEGNSKSSLGENISHLPSKWEPQRPHAANEG